MEDLATKIIPLVQMLIPGFITTMMFYWLADVKTPGQFERTIQALVGTGIITLLVACVRLALEFVGEKYPIFSPWSPTVESSWGVGLAVGIGLLLAYASNHDHFYRFARWLGLTSRASNSEWIFTFRRREGKNIVLTLLDGRRLFGYPSAWPASPKDGHFLITQPSWVDANDQWVDVVGVESYLICNTDVLMVEFME
ncbi:DUF6338 family protein [Pseudomonas sp. AF03-9]|uniref:DUF6338 family protein n=1 Tax=Pseudomonas sp. AF03-9 TaxID=2849867 RepID=UPI001CF9F0C9|nr:DUF6338 family protein [Pseudomonas sp. AF03-9]